jgi:hypothetical protein
MWIITQVDEELGDAIEIAEKIDISRPHFTDNRTWSACEWGAPTEADATSAIGTEQPCRRCSDAENADVGLSGSAAAADASASNLEADLREQKRTRLMARPLSRQSDRNVLRAVFTQPSA